MNMSDTTSCAITTSDGSSSMPHFAFTLLPQEIKLQVVKDCIGKSAIRDPRSIRRVCFYDLPKFKHMEVDGRNFEVTIKDLINWFYNEGSKLFPRRYVLDMLFPDGDIGRIPDEIEALRYAFGHAGIGGEDVYLLSYIFNITHMATVRNDALDWFPWPCGHQRFQYHVYLDAGTRGYAIPDTLDPESLGDYYWLHYLCAISEKEDQIATWIWQKGKHDEKDVDEWMVRWKLLPLWRFLGEYNTQKQTEADVQARYDFLSTLRIPQRKALDNSLNELVDFYARKHMHKEPEAHSTLYKICPDLTLNWEGYEGFTWQEFTRSGAFALCLKSTLLSVSYTSWIASLLEKDTDWNMVRWLARLEVNSPDFNEILEAELDESEDRCPVSPPEIIHSHTGNGSDVFRVDPCDYQVIKDVSMRRFVMIHPLWAWNQALELPQGQPLDISGQRPDDVDAGVIFVNRSATAHPEWYIDFWTSDIELGDFF